MANYQRMYKLLFNAVTDALLEMNNGDYIEAEFRLKKAQLRCEKIYNDTEIDIKVIDPSLLERGEGDGVIQIKQKSE